MSVRSEIVSHILSLTELPMTYAVGDVLSVTYPGEAETVPAIALIDSRHTDTIPMALVVILRDDDGEIDRGASAEHALKLSHLIAGMSTADPTAQDRAFVYEDDGVFRVGGHIAYLYGEAETSPIPAEAPAKKATKKAAKPAPPKQATAPKRASKKAGSKRAPVAPKKAPSRRK